MKEIKFRAWDKEKNAFLNLDWDDYYIDMSTGEVYEIEERSSGYTQYMHKRYLSQVVLMQFTGLKDKNGKEGFESDIVGLEDTLGEQFYGVIKWIGDKKAMYVIEMSGSHYPMSLLSDCEIVGNIYSNPELLEVTP